MTTATTLDEQQTFARFVATLSATQVRAHMSRDPEFARQLQHNYDTLPQALKTILDGICATANESDVQPSRERVAGAAGLPPTAPLENAPNAWERWTTWPQRSLDLERIYSPQELDEFDRTGAFHIPTREDCERIYTKCADDLKTANQTPCSTCEMAYPPTDIHTVQLSEDLLKSMRLNLCQPAMSEIPQFILSQYDASSNDTRLEGLLLYPPGVSLSDGETYLEVCSECLHSLQRGQLPRLAIANGNWIGRFPCGELPWIEEQLIALVSPCVSIKTVTGGSLRCLRSHHYIVKNTAGPILDMLPDQAASRVRVTMVGAMTPQQIAICKRRHTVDVPRAQGALRFLMGNHKSYCLRYEDQDIHLAAVGERLTDVVEDSTDLSDFPTRTATVQRIDDTSSYAVPAISEHLDPGAEDEWVEESSIILDQAEQTDDYLVRQSTAFLTTRQWADCIDMFPTLFPGGCGGPKEPRKKPLSVTAWARRVLKLHGCLFQRHEVFLLLVFDYLALENARKRMFFRLKATRDAISAGSVTREAIAECITYRQHLINCQAIGVSPDPPSNAIRHIINIQKGVETSEVAYFGSNRSRAQARSDLFGYIRRFGPLHVFFTVSPDASGVYSIGIQSGIINSEVVSAANAALLPTKSERRKIATRHPVECARYFIRVVDSIVKNVLGWDAEQQSPVRGGGLFGIVKAFTGAAETQVSGDLHAHFVVWLHGLPSTGTSMEEHVQQDAGFVERYVRLVDAVSTLTVQGLDSNCPSCGGKLKALTIPLRAFQRQHKNGSGPPPTSSCTSCGQTFKSHDLIDFVIARNGEPSSVEKDFIMCADPASRPDRRDERDIPAILREVQTHRWHHTPSCFKVTKKTPSAAVCRFLRPAPVHEESTRIDANLDVEQHRPIGSEYLNAYNPVLALLFRCNHDVRFILNGSSRDVAAYIFKYVMKPQNQIENDLAFRLGSMARVTNNVDARNATRELSDRERGNKILSGLIYAMTNRQEMPATMAALLVLRASAYWVSHPVVTLHIPSLLSTLDNTAEAEEDVSIPVEGIIHETPVYHQPNVLRAYWNRPTELHALSLVEVLEQFTFTRDKCKRNPLQKVVCLRGTKLIDIEDECDANDRELYFKILTLLFKPHRQDTLHQSPQTFEYAYTDFLRSGPQSAIDLALHYTTNLQDTYRASSAPDGPSPEELILSQHSALSGLDPRAEDTSFDEDDELPDHLDLIESIPDISGEHRLARFDTELEKDPVLAEALTDFGEESSTHHIDLPHSEIQVEDEGSSTGTSSFLQLYTTMPTRMEKLQECFSPIPWVDPATSIHYSQESLPRFAKIAEVSVAFKLNPWQHYAFETVARHVLYEYLKAIEIAAGEVFPRPSQHSLKQQLVGYMGGEAGAGKSTVIHALLAFARSWERVGSVETLAFTGVAAININGRTIHGARNLSIFEQDTRRPSAEMSAKFARVVLTVIDEVSMTDQKLLGRADAATKLMRPHRSSIWGGGHLLFCGDWKQIPPVGGTPAYQPKTNSSTGAQGYEVYKHINFVVFLIDNMRSRTDPVYTDILRRMRWGRLTEADTATLNTRVGATCGGSDQTKGFFKPVVVATNSLRCAVNYRASLEAGRTGRVQLFEAVAKASAASRNNFLKFSDFDDHLTGRLPLKFLYFIGMPVMITHRVSDPVLHDVVANGTIGHIIGHELKTSSFQVCSVDGVSIFRHPVLPVRLLVRVKDCDTVLYEGYSKGVVPIEPLHTKIAVEVPYQQAVKKRKRSGPSMTVDQFPMVPAFACTPEKLQGQTCKDGIIITNLERGTRKVSPQAHYVVFSRTVSLAKLTLTHPLTHDDASRFRPTPSTVGEMQRLQKMIVVPAYFNSSIVATFTAWLQTQCLH